MGSFVDVINNLVNTLQSDSTLDTFCREEWGKSLTIKKVFKKREEVGLTEFPLVMITRPQVSVEQENNIAYERKNTIRLYVGFHQPNREAALDEIIELEEMIEKALVQDMSVGGTVDMIIPGSSVNDEGYFHPVYFIAKEFEILKEDLWRG